MQNRTNFRTLRFSTPQTSVLASRVAVLKSHHGISLKRPQNQDTKPTDPSQIKTQVYCNRWMKTYWNSIHFAVGIGPFTETARPF